MEPYETGICPDMFGKGIKQAYIMCLSKSAIFPSNKVEFCHHLELSIKKCGFSADFAQVFSFGPDAFVAAPQAVETRALQPLGCHGEVMVGGIGMNSGNPEYVYKLSGFRSLWNSTESFMALNALIWTCMYVITWACALFLHGLDMVFGADEMGRKP